MASWPALEDLPGVVNIGREITVGIELVVAAVANEGVVAVAADEEVVAVVADKQIVTGAADKESIKRRCSGDVVWIVMFL